MGHAHDHTHADDQATYVLEQLCIIGMSAGLGLLAVLVYWNNKLGFPIGLNPVFHLPVLVGGITIVVFAAVRAVAVWFEVGQPAGKGHAHDHAHDCDGHDHCHDEHAHVGTESHAHEHTHDPAPEHTHSLAVLPSAPAQAHSHTHEDGHDHGWAPWRYVVLLLPIILSFLFLFLTPTSGLHAKDVDIGTLEGGAAVAVKDDHTVMELGFLELQDWARDASLREQYQGHVGRLRGQFVPGRNDKEFSLARFKIRCCAADAVQLNAVIFSTEPLDMRKLAQQWVEVEGVIEFRKRSGLEEYVPVLVVRSGHVQVVEPDAERYLY